MTIRRVAVVTNDDDLLQALRDRCPGYQFHSDTSDRDTRVIVVDQELRRDVPARLASMIVVGDHDETLRSSGDWVLSRATLVESAHVALSAAFRMAELRARNSALDAELAFARQVQELITIENFDTVIERVSRTLLEILDLSYVTLLLHESKVGRFVARFSNDPRESDDGEYVPGVPPSFLQHAFAADTPYTITTAEDEKPMLVFPLRLHDDVIGIARLSIEGEPPLSEQRLDRASRYVTAISGVMGNLYQLHRTSELAMRDDLTKAYNRRFFESYLDEEMERARRYGEIFSIIFLDLDDLKIVNDRFGHLAGSRTLQEVAKRILGAVRNIDKVVRFGGDEFCIILPQTDQHNAELVASRVQRSIGEDAMRIGGDEAIQITASFGVATYPMHAVTKEDLIRQADAAMYAVKTTTKNAIGVAGILSPTPASSRD
jgi:diguanylate cyclase (GGDEF)-like protein